MRGSPAPVIILCAPRSFSSVFCMMLGQHPKLYGFPELNLFVSDTVRELLDYESNDATVVGRHAGGYTAGVVRVLAELEFGGQSAQQVDAARRLLWQRRSWSTARLLNVLLEHVSPRRGVEKSPRTALSSANLARLGRNCPGARIIHLTREPFANVRSLVRANLPYSSSASERGAVRTGFIDFWARLWLTAQEAILHYCSTVSDVYRVRAEDVLASPELILQSIATWLDVDSRADAIAAMLHPERSPYACVGPSGVSGDNDPGFQNDPKLRQPLAEPVIEDAWIGALSPHLKNELRATAVRLGYMAL